MQITPTDLGHIAPGALYSPTGNFVLSVAGTVVYADPAPLTVTADDQARAYGSANPALTATYDGFVLGQGPADLSGTLECTTAADENSDAGDYAIDCGGQTSTNYDITYVPGTLTVDPAALTVTADDQARAYGSVNPALTASYDGFVLGQGPADLSGTLECTTAADENSDAGDYAIDCGGETSTNYDITYVPGTLTVDPAALTVTADDAARQVGAPDPAFTASYDGFVLGQGPADLSGTLECTTTATSESAPGDYAIDCGGQTSTNYAVTYEPGELEVVVAPSGVVTPKSDLVPGGTVDVDTDGWMPDSGVTVTVCGILVGSGTADGDGVFVGSFTLPDDLPVGPCDVVVEGTNLADQPSAVVMGITVTAAPVTPVTPPTPSTPASSVSPAGALPYTGSNVIGLVAGALLAIGAGFGLTTFEKRRRQI